jgi:hypothetical protein
MEIASASPRWFRNPEVRSMLIAIVGERKKVGRKIVKNGRVFESFDEDAKRQPTRRFRRKIGALC